MPLSISYSVGTGCSLPEGGCVIVLRPNSAFTLVSQDRYFLTNGTAVVTYGNSAPLTISTPYSGKEWQNYVDMWTYNTPTQIAVTPSTQFVQIVANNASIGNSIVTTIDNSGVDIETKPNSTIIVIGSSFSVDDKGFTEEKIRTFHYSNVQTVNVRTQDICKVIFVEEA